MLSSSLLHHSSVLPVSPLLSSVPPPLHFPGGCPLKAWQLSRKVTVPHPHPPVALSSLISSLTFPTSLTYSPSSLVFSDPYTAFSSPCSPTVYLILHLPHSHFIFTHFPHSCVVFILCSRSSILLLEFNVYNSMFVRICICVCIIYIHIL